MDILFLTHYFPPEVGAPQTRIFELALALHRRGHRIHVLAPFPHYPTGKIPAVYRGMATGMTLDQELAIEFEIPPKPGQPIHLGWEVLDDRTIEYFEGV